MTLTSVALSHSGRMLFAGTARGTMWSVKFPLTIPGEWQEHQGHGAAITKVTQLFLWVPTGRRGRGGGEARRDRGTSGTEEGMRAGRERGTSGTEGMWD